MSWLRKFLSNREIAVAMIALLVGWGAAWGAEDERVSATGGYDYDFGDAPEGVIAYPDDGVVGMFPTCVTVGPASWIQHTSRGQLYFGAKVDLESDGNGGQCPTFTPNLYDVDETFETDGDAGLIMPRAYTIKGSPGFQTVVDLSTTGLESMGNACMIATWGAAIDIRVHNSRSDRQPAYVNVLFDWNHDGLWAGASRCADVNVPEHVLVNFAVPYGYDGPLSALGPQSFKMGPRGGYVWARFSITEQPVPKDWNGDGAFDEGETEDYLLSLREPLEFCDWEPEEPHAMHWAQLPDMQTTGVGVSLTNARLADNFQATEDGPLTEIHFWASFMDNVMPRTVDGLTFEICVYSNEPADSTTPWSRPGKLLWKTEVPRYTYDIHEISNNIWATWYDPNALIWEAGDHNRTWQYDICLDDEDELFEMTRGTTYWIEIRDFPDKEAVYSIGWKATLQMRQYGDNAVWFDPDLGWQPLVYPEDHVFYRDPLDLAFVVVGPPVQEDLDFGDAPDPTYPTKLASNGARHTIWSDVYLGRGVDGERDGQPDSTASGDDIVDTDDEDGVVFTTDLVPGEPAVLQVTASARGYLNAWIDWNADGDWDDADEQAVTDLLLNAGANVVTIDVPGRAAAGRTFARFRFSTARGLEYYGMAPDGEVEDYMIQVQESFRVLPPTEHIKWSQPPIETDPGLETIVFCGWDESAYVSKASQYSIGTWYLPADNFRCISDAPVTSVHWWGSYEGWAEAAAPGIKPDSWRIGFWSNAPADGRYNFGRPNELLWAVTVPSSRVQEEWTGYDVFPQESSDATFRYTADLGASEYFNQGRYVASTQDRMFWISITAVYAGSPGPTYPWGWKTRPEPWADGAIAAQFRTDDIRTGFVLDPTMMLPVTNSLLCERLDRYDLAFELDTDPAYIKWEQAFTDLRDWPYYEDEQSLATGTTSLSARRTVADDWRCTTAEPITAIAWWGSYLGYGYLPAECQQMTSPEPPDYFLLSLWSDVPSSDASNPRGYSYPGRKVWEYQADSFEEVLVGFDRDAASQGYEPVYRYVVRLPEDNWYRQDGENNVLWLSVQAVYRSGKSIVYPWGWTNHAYAAWDMVELAPLAHWKFDESAGATAADSSGNGSDGIVYGNPTWRTSGGWFDGALDFDGRGDYVRVDRPMGFDFAPGSFTVSAWIYPRETTGQYRAILEYDRDSVNGNRFGLWLDENGCVHFRVGLNTWQSVNALRANHWYHVAGTFETGTKAMRIYVDGVLEATATNQKGFVAPTQATLIIGARGSADDEYFNGLLDDIRVFDSLLTGDEVLILAGAGRNEGAVYTTTSNTSVVASWSQLLDPTGEIEDMSFMLFTQPMTVSVSVDAKDDTRGDSSESTTKVEEKK